MSNFDFIRGLLGLSFVLSSSSGAATVQVDGRSTGGFGGLNTGYYALTSGHVFAAAGEAITITATGTVDTATNTADPAFDAAPDGYTGIIDGVAFGGDSYMPLEEAAVDNLTLTLPRTGTIPNVGALFGVFVPFATTQLAGFSAVDEDLGGHVPATGLFLIGSGPFDYVSPGPGTLFFGINESFAANNGGFFDVEIVPEPAAAALMALGLAAWSFRRRAR